jgi:class 3 adenylate cyclase
VSTRRRVEGPLPRGSIAKGLERSKAKRPDVCATAGTEHREAILIERDAEQTARASEQQVHIAEIERRNAAFAHFVPTQFLRQLERPDIIEVQLGDHVERDMAVLFTDIRGFTGLSERLSPPETFAFLNEYLARVGPLIRSHGGFIDKYIGDGIVALFAGSPGDALDAAVALQSEVRRFNEDRARRGDEPIAVGVGINYGRMNASRRRSSPTP